ncbi:Bifunctional protein HldE [Trichinella pseudospiralis]
MERCMESFNRLAPGMKSLPLILSQRSTAHQAGSAKKSRKVCEVGSSAYFPQLNLSTEIGRVSWAASCGNAMRKPDSAVSGYL